MSETFLAFGLFTLFVLGLLAIDLGLFHKKSHEVSIKEALTWTFVWVVLAMIFNIGIYFWKGQEKALEFFTGYLVEKSLSVDNLFVFLMIFAFFKVPKLYQHKVLFWGIIGALLLRAVMIGAGAAIVANFHWVLYIFGLFLLYTGIKMLVQKEDDSISFEDNKVISTVKKLMPVTDKYHDGSFFIRNAGVLTATPLFLVLVLVEFSDVIFAVDSIPAIFGITEDPFIVYTSNVFAILGLRSLFFALAGVMDKFHYLKIGLSIVLMFIGTKMLVADFYKVPIMLALLVVVSVLVISVVLSLVFPKKEEQTDATDKSNEAEKTMA